MNNEREILFNSVAAIINIQPTNDIFLRIMTSRDITVVTSLAQFIDGCFKQIESIINHKSPVAILSILSCLHDLTRVLPHIRTAVALGSYYFAFQGRLGTFPSPLLSDEVGISELLSQLILSVRSGMFFFDCNSGYVALTRS